MDKKGALSWVLHSAPVVILMFLASVPTLEMLSEGERAPMNILQSLWSGTLMFIVFLAPLSLIKYVYRRLTGRYIDRAKSFVMPPGSIRVGISMMKANLVGLAIMAAVFGLFRGIWWVVYGPIPETSGQVAVNIVVLVFFHELSHALGWILGGAPIRTIRLGIYWRYLAPYAHCNVPTSMGVLRFALMLPLVTTGLLPFVLSLVYGNVDLGIASVFLIGGAGGDLSMLFAGIAFHSSTRVQDHPGAPATVILNKGNLS
jgi:hypothetical protein